MLTLEPGLHTIELVPASDPSTRLQKRVMVQGGRLATIRFQVAPPRPPEPQPSAASQVDEESPPASPPASPARPPARRERAPSASAPPTVSEQQPAMGSVYVLADAPGYVFVDGVNTGKVTPVRLKLPPGQHEIVIVVQRTNERLRHEIDVKPGKLLKLRFRLGSQ